jgi:predicted protein tyrosine phosphatase
MKNTTTMHPTISILSREEASRFSTVEPYAIVAVTDPELPDGSYAASGQRQRLLQLKFNDIRYACCVKHRLFDDADARRIAEFAEWFQTSGIKQLVVHCEAGISRSSAIALTIGRFLGLDIDEVLDPQKRYRPNPFVVWRLSRLLMPGREGEVLSELYAWLAEHAPEMAEAMGEDCIG